MLTPSVNVLVLWIAIHHGLVRVQAAFLIRREYVSIVDHHPMRTHSSGAFWQAVSQEGCTRLNIAQIEVGSVVDESCGVHRRFR